MAINEYDELLENMDNEQQGKISKPIANEYDELLTREESAFGETIKQGHAKAPEVSTQVLDIQKKTGLPAAFVEQNLEPLKQKQLKAEAEDFRRAHPITGQWLAESPYHSSIVKDDIDNLGALERGYRAFSGGWKKAGLQGELADLLSAELDGGDFVLGSAQARKRDELKAQIQALSEEESQYQAGSYIASTTGYTVRQFGQSFKEAAEGGLAGGIVGAGAGSLLPGVGTVAGGTAGTVSGSVVAMGNYAYRQEAAFAFDEFRGMKDFEGNQFDPDTARNAARGVGVVNATIEVLSDTAVALLVPGAKSVIGKSLGTDAAKLAIRSKVKSALANPTTRGAILSALGKMGTGASIEGLEEFFQELVGAGGRESAQAISGQEFDPDSFATDIQRAMGAAKDAFVGTFFTLAPLGGVQLYTQLGEVKKAEQNRQFFEALGQTAEGSKIRERLPDAFEQVVDRLTKDGPIETLYAPVETWNIYWQGKGVDPKAIAEDVLGETKTYDEAIVSGGDIPIPLPRYARKIAPTEHNVFFIDELRTSPTEMNARESREFMAKLEEEANAQPEAAPAEEPGAKVGDIITENLMAAGVEESAARAQSSIYEAAFSTLGQRAGIDPIELFNRYGLTITRGEPKQRATSSVDIEAALSKWETEGGFAPGDMPESVDALSAKLGIEFGPEAAGIVKGVFLPRRVTVNEDGSLNLTHSQKTTLELVRQEVEAGEAGTRHFREGEVGGDQVVTAIPSTFPEYFRDKGYSKKETMTAIDKALASLPLGTRQAAIVQDLNQGYRQQAFEELRRIRAERMVVDDATGEKITQEEWSRRYFQDDARARITFGPGGVNIALLKDANLSSFLHETGHFYLEVLGDLAQAPDAPQDIKDDYATLLDWFGVKDRKEIQTEHHEKFARGFESYLMDGKAPTDTLRAAFARFRAWLIAVYRSVINLNVELTPEVRDVMDRLLATEEEIRIARQKQNIAPLFADPATLGMSEKEVARYAKAIEEAKQSAEEELSSKLMAQVNREIKAWWKEERAKVYEAVKEEVDNQPVYIALSVLQGTRANLPEGVEPVKLSKKSIVELFGGEARLKTLPKPHIYAVEGGMNPDDAADLFGFTSGDELLNALANAEPRKALINRLTDERMEALHPDLPTDPGKLSEEAMKAVHNEKREELLRLELEHLAAGNLPALKGMMRKVARKVPSTESMRAFAEKTIAGKMEKDIKPHLHSRAEARAARKAIDAFNNGDFDLAFYMKLQEAIAHELYMAAIKAREEVDGIVEYAKKFDKTSVREKMGKAGADYLEQIDAILDRYSFKTTTLKALEKRKSLLAWTKEQEAQGLTVAIPDALLSEAARQHYRETTVEELRGVRDTLKQIEHLTRLKNKLLASEKSRDFTEAQDEIIASIEAHHDIKPEPVDFAPGLGKRLFTKARKLAASHTKLEFLFEFLDGNKARGPVWELLFKPFTDADDAKSRMNRDVAANMRRIFGSYTRKERATWFLKKTFIPLIGKSMNKANMLAVALNQGNAYNRQAVMDGYGWNDDQVEAILSHLDKRDWDIVQAIWDYIDSFWPEVKRIEEEITGLAPAKVEAAPVKTKFGEYAGGYYPIVFDRDKSWRQTQLTEEEQVREMFGGKRGRAMTKHGHTIERTNTGGKPILLELTGMTEHIESVIHDLAYRRAIIDVHRLANSERVRQAIIGAAGSEMYAQIMPWLRTIAADRRKEPTAHFETLFAKARHGATIVNMGWKMTTAIVQLMGYTVSVKELGAKYAALGLKDAFLKPYALADKWEFITERSEFMKERPRNYDRDVRDTLRGMGAIGKQGIGTAVDAYTIGLKSSWFALIAYMDMAISIPTWLGAYRKAIDGGIENITIGDEKAAAEFADRTVRMTQSSGAAKDLASIQTGSETWKLFTMFYSYFSLLFNQFGKTATQFRFDRNVPKLIGSLLLLWFLPAVMEDLLLGRGPDDDDDEDRWLKWAAKNEVMYPFQSVVIARDLVNGMDKFGYEPSAAFDVFEKAVKTGKLGVDLATGEKEEITRTNIKDAVMLTGYFAQLPTRQIWLTGEYFHDWMTGEQEPESIGEGIWRVLVVGKKKD